MTRLSNVPTLRIDPSHPISFKYRKTSCQGIKGDTVATALYDNGIRIFSRSIKYHRPRGLYSLDGESGNCLMEIDGVPNVSAERTVLREGMHIHPQNVLGSPENDILGIMNAFDRFMPAGFYYRFFHKPYRLWPFFQKMIRKAAGIGKLSPDFRMKGRFDQQYVTVDVCVIGGGPAGISAALTAAEYGLRTAIVEEKPWLGGYYDYRSAAYAPNEPLYERSRKLARLVNENPHIRVFKQTSAIGVYPDYLVTAIRNGNENDGFDQRYMEIRAKHLVVATGCIERPLIFENNDRPGIMQAECALRLAKTYGIMPGKTAVFSIGHDIGIEAAIELHDLGMEIQCVADVRHDGQDEKRIEDLTKRNIPFLRGWIASKAQGRKQLEKVTLSSLEGKWQKTFHTDLLAASAGLTSASGPLSLAGARMAYDLQTGFFLPKSLPTGVHAAGRTIGFHDPASVETSGHLAGLLAVKGCDTATSCDAAIDEIRQKLEQLPGAPIGSKVALAPGKAKKSFICFDEDVTIKHIDQSGEMGFDSPELAKRFSAAGTGPSQGGIPGHNLSLVMAQRSGGVQSISPPTTVRPPLRPTLLAAYAGKHHAFHKRTPLHRSQEKAGGIFRRAGDWKRARYFSDDFTSRDEILNVRNNVGIIDVSTLGKFRIFGTDAQKALQRVYVGDMAKTFSWRAKYSAMCNEDGNLIDDGVIIQRKENDFYFTTSTGRAGATIEWIRYHTRYDGWDFHIVNLTDAFGAINIAGPNARAVMQKITDANFTNDAFPFMAYREFNLKNGIPVRAMRLGFVGEISYELHVPSSYTAAVWEAILEAGKEFDIQPFGLEAQNVLRLEKGHVIIGQESEIRTTLHDLGMGFAWSRKAAGVDTIGVYALKHTEHQEGRLKLVGFKTDNGKPTPKDGSLIVDDETIRGYICTARYSFTLEHGVGMALVESDYLKTGKPLTIFEDGAGKDRLYAGIVKPPFYDPEGKRVSM